MSGKFKRITQDLQLSHLESLPLRHIVDELAELGNDQCAMAFGEPRNPVCAVVILRGEHTGARLDALERREPISRTAAAAVIRQYLKEQPPTRDLHQAMRRRIQMDLADALEHSEKEQRS